MTIFYWVMGVLIVGTLVPSVFFLLIYAFTGRDEAARRARTLWNVTRVFAFLGIDILVWGHLIVAIWQMWRS
ncbi:conserved hypothetical protein [Rubrivivax sp. A210]|uniref:hypothetical protein n=1 Tax=Rubrivivax sp. A210 TaxID=2772301 RepID=UPI00191B51DF|nr:hypothetical protein [Rubrivivax sp. A210]CAD5372892.1 conserved hypothetical protein [Rubrivivax sp. A210]